MKSLAEAIMKWAASRPEGTVIRAKSLLRLGSRAGIDQALSRLTREKKLMRASRGAYLLPVKGKFGERPPEPARVVEALIAAEGEMIARSGAAAANALGLTTQVPIRAVYVTSGRSRRMKLGAQVLEIQHVPKWQVAMSGRPAGEAIRALAWLGPKRANEALKLLKKQLPSTELEELASAGALMPSWMAAAVAEALPYHG